jgi:murein L,D-transpeptidase YcbB/YkuD
MKQGMYTGMMGWCVVIFLSIQSCGIADVKPPEKDIVVQPEKFEIRVSDNLKTALNFILDNKGRLSDTVLLATDSLVHKLYEQENFQPLWCAQENWLPIGDSLFSFIEHSKEYGLFPSYYHYRALSGVRKLIDGDSVSRKDAALWSRADMMLTDAFFLMTRHLKQGHLKYDSVTLRTDSVLGNDFYMNVFQQMRTNRNVTATLHDLEPKLMGYDSLKMGLKFFLDSIQTFKRYTYIKYPNRDSASLRGAVQRRLFEDDYLSSGTQPVDTATWRQALMSYQQSKGLKTTGKVNENTVNSLNNTDWEKFKRVAITLDRYKLLPDTLPPIYIWVNIPAFSLSVMDTDTLVMASRVIVGNPKTRTPLLTSNVSNFIIYPQWTVPMSIISKEMLPKIKKSIAYLDKENLMVVDPRNDSIIDPTTLDWTRYSKTYFPYLLKQRQGDDNSLGVLKFNFANKYSVYLHDTNARWLFGQNSRALSHGCVRVKDFLKLADFLVRDDTLRYHPDTLRNWIRRQEKHVVSGFQRVPIFIRYFSCEGKNGKLKIYDDVYAEDKILRERYFADKTIL